MFGERFRAGPVLFPAFRRQSRLRSWSRVKLFPAWVACHRPARKPEKQQTNNLIRPSGRTEGYPTPQTRETYPESVAPVVSLFLFASLKPMSFRSRDTKQSKPQQPRPRRYDAARHVAAEVMKLKYGHIAAPESVTERQAKGIDAVEGGFVSANLPREKRDALLREIGQTTCDVIAPDPRSLVGADRYTFTERGWFDDLPVAPRA